MLFALIRSGSILPEMAEGVNRQGLPSKSFQVTLLQVAFLQWVATGAILSLLASIWAVTGPFQPPRVWGAHY